MQKVKQKEKEKEKKSESVFFVLGARYCPHFVGVTCIDRRQTTADRGEEVGGTGGTKWNETKRESAALKLQYILPQFCFCCFFYFVCD